jgi:hypothetical protein
MSASVSKASVLGLMEWGMDCLSQEALRLGFAAPKINW